MRKFRGHIHRMSNTSSVLITQLLFHCVYMCMSSSVFRIVGTNQQQLLIQCRFVFVSFFFASSFIPKTTSLAPLSSLALAVSKGPQSSIISFSIRNMSTSTISSSSVLRADRIDSYDGVTVEMKEPMDSNVFASMLTASLSLWREQGKKGVWIKLPLKLANLVEPAVQQGFRYHHAEPDYVMLVHWIPETADTIPANASHRVGVGAFVMNHKGQVLVVQEFNGSFKGTGVWKLPTGVVNEGEDISAAAIREVKEETGVDTEFVEVLAFRQSHKSFFQKSDLFFVCMLRPLSLDIEKQGLEIEAAQWMAAVDYASQPFVQKHQMFNNIAKICLTKSEKDYSGFSPVPSTSASGKTTYLFFNKKDCHL